jgi:hypothetical protein
MPTMDELILSIEVERDQAIKRRDRAIAEVKTILQRAKEDGRANLTPAEDGDVKSAFEIRDRAITELSGIDAKLDNARKVKEAEAESRSRCTSGPRTRACRSRLTTGSPAWALRSAPTTRATTARAPASSATSPSSSCTATWSPSSGCCGTCRKSASSGPNTCSAPPVPVRSPASPCRSTSPTCTHPAVAALRPFADQCNHHDLPPDGMTVNISRITTATSVAVQASENTAVSETNIDDTLLTENVQTAAGQQTLSRQAIDRGTGVEEIVMDDLFRRYATTLDSARSSTRPPPAWPPCPRRRRTRHRSPRPAPTAPSSARRPPSRARCSAGRSPTSS